MASLATVPVKPCSVRASRAHCQQSTSLRPFRGTCRLRRRVSCHCSPSQAATSTTTTESDASATAVPTATSSSSSTGRDGLSPEQQEAWAECVQQLAAIGVSEEDADKHVARAFGWGSQAYWRREKVEAPPDPGMVSAALAFLAELGLSQAEVAKVVKAFPEVLGCEAEGQLRKNTNKLTQDWKMTGQVLAKAVIRSPAVLGYTIDCMGDCAGECNKCWVRF